jgi:hypothetical protein
MAVRATCGHASGVDMPYEPLGVRLTILTVSHTLQTKQPEFQTRGYTSSLKYSEGKGGR